MIKNRGRGAESDSSDRLSSEHSLGKQKKTKALPDTRPQSTFKIDETSKKSRIDSINRISKEFRPLGKVIAIVSSPNTLKDQIVTIRIIDKDLFNYKMLVKMNKKIQQNN